MSALRFQSKGALRQEALYVERQADSELLEKLLAGEFCYILAPRQIGKSSLRVRTERLLSKRGVRCATVDLTKIGTSGVVAEEWYFGVIREIARRLSLPVIVEEFWENTQGLSPAHRLSTFFEVIVDHLTTPVVIFLDEIESVLPLAFARDDFFATIRSVYNERAERAGFRLLTFCLLGVAAPWDLSRDPHRTPFNTGHAIRLEDFKPTEATAFLPGLAETWGAQSEAILTTVLSWTSGHPYMTQRLCEELTEPERWQKLTAEQFSDKAVDHLVTELFLSQSLADPNLLVAQQIFTQERPTYQLLQMCKLYERLLQGEQVPASGSDQIQMSLRLTGMAAERHRDGASYLAVRNRIFATIFDREWVHRTELQQKDSEYNDQTQRNFLDRDRPVAMAVRINRSEEIDLASVRHKNLAQQLASEPLPFQPPNEIHIGTVVSNYRLVRVLGENGISIVYEAAHTYSGSRAAVKFITLDENDRSLAARLLENELKITTQADHPGIVNSFGYGELRDGTPYLILEYPDGEELSERLARLHLLPVNTALYFTEQIAAAMHYLHSRGIVHRCLAPRNIVLVADSAVSRGERIKILDFSLALFDKNSFERQGAVTGIPLYMAPEQCSAPIRANDRSDVYSLGIILYQMLSGKVPFEEHLQQGFHILLMAKVASDVFRLEFTPPPPVAQLLVRMLAKNPADRPTMAEVVDECRKLLLRSADSVSTRSAPLRTLGAPIRRRLWISVVGAFLATFVTFGVARLWQGTNISSQPTDMHGGTPRLSAVQDLAPGSSVPYIVGHESTSTIRDLAQSTSTIRDLAQSTSTIRDLAHGQDLSIAVRVMSPHPQGSLNQQLYTAQRALKSGELDEAIRYALTLSRLRSGGNEPLRRAAWRIIGLAACQQMNIDLAEDAYAHLNGSREAEEIRDTCLKKGFKYEDGVFQPTYKR